MRAGEILWQSPEGQRPQWRVVVHKDSSGNNPIQLRFQCLGRLIGLRRIATWLPTVAAWDARGWVPNGDDRRVPSAVVQAVEAALKRPRVEVER